MKFKNREIKGPNSEIIVIPRPSVFEPKVPPEMDSEGKEVLEEVVMDMPFICKAVLDYSSFESLCPVPMPKKMRKPGMSAAVDNPEDPDYLAAIRGYNEKRLNWMFFKSIEDSPDFEWEKVKVDDPTTWHLWRQELQESGFNNVEIGTIYNRVMTVNSIDRDKMEEAKKRFLAGRPQPESN